MNLAVVIIGIPSAIAVSAFYGSVDKAKQKKADPTSVLSESCSGIIHRKQ